MKVESHSYYIIYDQYSWADCEVDQPQCDNMIMILEVDHCVPTCTLSSLHGLAIKTWIRHTDAFLVSRLIQKPLEKSRCSHYLYNIWTLQLPLKIQATMMILLNTCTILSMHVSFFCIKQPDLIITWRLVSINYETRALVIQLWTKLFPE